MATIDPELFFQFLTHFAVLVGGTEAAGFAVERADDAGPITLRRVAHIRPDDSTNETRAAAMKAFEEIVTPCVNLGKDGAIRVAVREGNEGPGDQYCLVTLLREGETIRAAAAVVCRCDSPEQAGGLVTDLRVGLKKAAMGDWKRPL